MYNMNHYRYGNSKKTRATRLMKTSIQLGVVLVVLLVLMLFKYTKNETGMRLNEKVRGVFYTDYTDEAQSVFSNAAPLLNNYINKEGKGEEVTDDDNDDFIIESLPVNGEITSAFGTRIHPVTNKSETHSGVDIAAAEGTEVKAIYDGVVEDTTEDEILGIVVTINHENGFKTKYGHLSEVKVAKGDIVKKDSVFALTGSTGLSTGPHLHFEVLFNNESVDPANLIKAISN